MVRTLVSHTSSEGSIPSDPTMTIRQRIVDAISPFYYPEVLGSIADDIIEMYQQWNHEQIKILVSGNSPFDGTVEEYSDVGVILLTLPKKLPD